VGLEISGRPYFFQFTLTMLPQFSFAFYAKQNRRLFPPYILSCFVFCFVVLRLGLVFSISFLLFVFALSALPLSFQGKSSFVHWYPLMIVFFWYYLFRRALCPLPPKNYILPPQLGAVVFPPVPVLPKEVASCRGLFSPVLAFLLF